MGMDASKVQGNLSEKCSSAVNHTLLILAQKPWCSLGRFLTLKTGLVFWDVPGTRLVRLYTHPLLLLPEAKVPAEGERSPLPTR